MWDLELLYNKFNGVDPVKETIKANVKLGVVRCLQKDLEKWVNESRAQFKGNFKNIENFSRY